VLGLTVTGLETGTFALLAREVTPKSKGSQGDKRRTGSRDGLHRSKSKCHGRASACAEIFMKGIVKAGVETPGGGISEMQGCPYFTACL
jgi:hypothetical protein